MNVCLLIGTTGIDSETLSRILARAYFVNDDEILGQIIIDVLFWDKKSSLLSE